MDTQPKWPERVRELAGELRGASGREARQDLLGRLWLLLAAGLDLQVRRHAARLGPLGPEDREDVVSDKASDLLRRLDEGVWRPESEPAAKTVAFVSTLARNGVVDRLRRSGPRVQADLDPECEMSRDAGPDARVESRAFAAALVACAGALPPRARVVWFLRVMHELPSKVIASHPEVEMTLSNVDVTLLRSRRSLKRCMESKGFEVTRVPRGAFEELWIAFRVERSPEDRGWIT